MFNFVFLQLRRLAFHCKRLRISHLFFIVSVRRSCQLSLFFSLSTFTLTLVRRAASPSRKVSSTQKPVVYPPTLGYSAPPLSSFLFPAFIPHQDIRIIILGTPVHHPSISISFPKPGISPQSVPSLE